MDGFVRRRIEDIACDLGIAPADRPTRLADALAVLGGAEAHRLAVDIAWHAHEVLFGAPRQTRSDRALVDALDAAAWAVALVAVSSVPSPALEMVAA